MPPQSRGMPVKPPASPYGFQSRSTPNLPTLNSFQALSSSSNGSTTPASNAAPSIADKGSPEGVTSPSEPASIEDFSLDSGPLRSDDEDGSDVEGEGEGEGLEETNNVEHAPPRPIMRPSKSHTYLGPAMFAPPFYGRPPTPLPPSPSLTSLLRPNFSQNSRPTTPDPSSDEGTPNTRDNVTGTQTPNSAAASTLTSTYRMAKPIARASPKVPTYEYYGFTLYLISSLIFVMYLFWSFLPKAFLNQLGIYYYPDRWWALAIPAWTVMFILYIYVALACYNTGYLTLPLDSLECLVDEAGHVAVIDAQGNLVRDNQSSWQLHRPEPIRGEENGRQGKSKCRGESRQISNSKPRSSTLDHELDWRMLWKEGTDAVMDIPIGGVCEILYGQETSVDHDAHDDAHRNFHDR